MSPKDQNNPSNDNTTHTVVSKIFDMLANKEGPAQIGRPIFEKHLQAAHIRGYHTPELIFGKRLRSDDLITTAVPINLGSKEACKEMPEESRIMLFLFKKALSNVEIQASYKCRTTTPTADQMKSVPLYKAQLEPMMKAFNVTDFSAWIDQVQARFFFEEFEIPYLLAKSFIVNTNCRGY